MSTYKEYMIKALHKLYRADEWINELYQSIGAVLTEISIQVEQDLKNLYFDSLDETAAENFEKDLNIKPTSSQTLADRGAVIQSKWLAKKFASLPVIQAIADSFYPVGDIICKYADAEIDYQVHHHLAPLDASAMIDAVDEIKPAHIGYKLTYVYNKWKDYYFPLFWQDEQSREWVDLQPEDWKNQYANTKTWSYCNTRTWEEHLIKDID